MRLFISGPMRGTPQKNKPAFLEAETMLRLGGYRVHNPAHCEPLGLSFLSGMRHHLPFLVECDGVAVLPGWEDSEGACIEVGLMRDLGLPVHTVSEWLQLEPEVVVER